MDNLKVLYYGIAAIIFIVVVTAIIYSLIGVDKTCKPPKDEVKAPKKRITEDDVLVAMKKSNYRLYMCKNCGEMHDASVFQAKNYCKVCKLWICPVCAKDGICAECKPKLEVNGKQRGMIPEYMIMDDLREEEVIYTSEKGAMEMDSAVNEWLDNLNKNCKKEE